MNQLASLLRASLLTAALLATPAAFAQNAAAPSGEDAQAADVSAEEVKSFANAHLKVIEVQQEYIPRIGQAESSEEAEKLQHEANEQMIEAVRSEGLDAERYMAIASAADQDEALRQRIVEQLEAESQ